MSTRNCPLCRAAFGKKERFCKYCGAPLINLCTHDGGPFGEPCGHVNDPDAAFCTACGHETLYRKTGVLSGRFRRIPLNDDDAELKHFDHPFFSST